MKKSRITIIVPAYNEEDYIYTWLCSLANQTDLQGYLISHDLFQIVIVDNNCTDHTVDVINKFKNEHKDIKCYVVQEKIKGIVAARIAGYNFILNDKSLTTELLASSDADVVFHPHWVYTILRKYDLKKYDLLSNAGCFSLDFWKKVPNLALRYLEEIGTIFFNHETIEYFGAKGKEYFFTEQIFFDFIRLATDQCFVIRSETYKQVGGYTRDFIDKEKTKEFFDEGGRLLVKVEQTSAKIVYSNEAPYSASPRRILAEPDKFLTGKSYVNGIFNDYRQTSESNYERLNQLALEIDYSYIRKYIIKNYIFLKCITRPLLITDHPEYFGRLTKEIVDKIDIWWKVTVNISGKEVMWFAEELTNEYYNQLIDILPKQKVTY